MFISNLICSSLIPAMCLLIGLLVKKRPPKNINWFLGYRTARSMQSQESWDYAQSRLGELLRKYSLPVLVISLLPVILFKAAGEELQSLVLLVVTFSQLAAIIAIIFIIEKELKDKFK